MVKSNLTRVALIIVVAIFALSGCNLYGLEEVPEIDPPPITLELDNSKIIDEVMEITQEEVVVTNIEDVTFNEDSGTIKHTIYYFNDNNEVTPLTLDIPKVEGIGQQVLNYMTINGPVQELLPQGFSAILPEGTQFSLNVKADQQLAIVDFSTEFLNYEAKSAEKEKKILDAITWSLTEFPTIEKVEIRVNGYDLENMPVWNTPIVGPLSRNDGINLELANNINISNTSSVTLYFVRANEENEYFVPVTRIIPQTDNIAKETLEQLIIGPQVGSNLVTPILPTTNVINVKVSDNIIVADFDEGILGYDNQLSEQMIDMILYSLSESTNISTIQIKIDGETKDLPNELLVPIIADDVINATIL